MVFAVGEGDIPGHWFSRYGTKLPILFWCATATQSCPPHWLFLQIPPWLSYTDKLPGPEKLPNITNLYEKLTGYGRHFFWLIRISDVCSYSREMEAEMLLRPGSPRPRPDQDQTGRDQDQDQTCRDRDQDQGGRDQDQDLKKWSWSVSRPRPGLEICMQCVV